MLCNVTAEPHSNVLSSTGADGRLVITVTVGAVTVDVHTTTALRSNLSAWRRPPPSPGCSRTPATTTPSPTGRAACAPSPTRSAVHSRNARPAARPPAPRRSTHDTDPAARPDHRSGFVVLDADLSGRPPLVHAGDYDAALYVLYVVQEEFYDQFDANGEGGHTVHLAPALAPIDATGTIGPAFHFETINGMRSAER